MFSNQITQKSSWLFSGLLLACFGLALGLAEPARADSSLGMGQMDSSDKGSVPIQLEITTRQRIGWTQAWAEYRVSVAKPEGVGIRDVTVQYKVIDLDDNCDATASWATNLDSNSHRRHVLLDRWKTKPNYLLFLKNSLLQYLGKKFCFKASKSPGANHYYLPGYAEITVEKWWKDVETGCACPSVYVWIDQDSIMRGGQTTLRWKISNVSNLDSVRITARNHDYWFYDTAEAEPNIKKAAGNLHEVTLTHDSSSSRVAAFRTVVGHLAPRVDNLYFVSVHRDGCPVARDAVYMRVSD